MPASNDDRWDKLLARLDRLERRIVAAAERGMEAGAPVLQTYARTHHGYGAALIRRARATLSHYQDTTGALESTTIAYVATKKRRNQAIYAQARAQGEALRPGQTVQNAAPGPDDDEIAIVLTSPMKYGADVELDRGGRGAWCAPAIQAMGADIFALAMAEVARGFE